MGNNEHSKMPLEEKGKKGAGIREEKYTREEPKKGAETFEKKGSGFQSEIGKKQGETLKKDRK